MIRTRSIIKNLSYDDLLNRGLIPDLVSSINQSPTANTVKRYPPFVYKNKCYSFMGVIIDYVIRAGLRINLDQKIDLGIDPITDIFCNLSEIELSSAIASLEIYQTSRNINDVVNSSFDICCIGGEAEFDRTEIAKYVPTIVNMIKEITTKWKNYGEHLSGTISFNKKYSYKSFEGHPDIVVDSTVFDIKNTSSFSKMSKESSLQILAYYALMKSNLPSLKYVGFVLPMQRDVLMFNIESWDFRPYLELLNVEAEKLLFSSHQPILIIDVSSLLLPASCVGSHIAKGKNIASSLSKFASNCPGLPCQMYLANPRTGRRSPDTNKQIISASKVVSSYNLSYFTHSSLVINLSANEYDPVTGFWQQNILNEELALTSSIGGKGLVVHTGFRLSNTEDYALNTMETMVRNALSFTTDSCPLLLETPCGEGTEIVTKLEELGYFFYRFTTEERRKLGVCIDTCHVFAAGYDPLSYLSHWEEFCKIPIGLVHFNDSARECGCCVDRHAPPGCGHIGLEKMILIMKWCSDRSIPMVRE